MEEQAIYTTTDFVQEDLMSGKIRVMVPQLMRERKITPMNLLYGARLAPGTAYTLADEERSQGLTSMSFDVLVKLCKFFDVGVSDILKYDRDNPES